jgi:hypothetical protein
MLINTKLKAGLFVHNDFENEIICVNSCSSWIKYL